MKGTRHLANSRDQIKLFLMILFATIPISIVILSTSVRAAPQNVITVNSLADVVADNGDCTLREAIISTNTNTASGVMPGECSAGTSGMDTITFGVTGTILLQNGLTQVNEDLTIIGPSGGITIDGNNSFKITNVGPGVNLNLVNLTMTRAYVWGGAGGAIANGGALNIIDSVFSDNSAAGSGSGGAIFNYGVLTITNSIFFANSAYSGGAIYNENIAVIANSSLNNNIATGDGGSVGGGGVYNYSGALTITNSMLSNNSAAAGAGGGIHDMGGRVNLINTSFYSNSARYYGGGLFFNSYDLIIANTTFYSNSVTFGGGGIASFGIVTITNSTFFKNTASGGGGISNWGILSVINSTFSDNSASSANGGAIRNILSTTLYNTIVANSPSGGNCYGTITNGGNNIDDGTTCGWGSSSGSMSNTNPLLGSLANNGGSTQTMALLLGSPAIDAGNDAKCPSTDQRGAQRPIGQHCDIGAYEAGYLFLPFIVR